MGREQLIQQLLKEKRCGLWPDCSCHQTLLHWQAQLPNEDITWTFNQLSWAETTIYLTLECVSAHCPDPKVRQYATFQLLSPWWNWQRKGIELDQRVKRW